MKLAELQYSVSPIKKKVVEFKGLNKKAVIEDGEMREMKNLSSDEYSYLTQRKLRGIYSDSYENPRRMIVKNKKLAVISGNEFWYDDELFPAVKIGEKTEMVAINRKICFFPEKVYFDTKSKEVGNLEAKYDSLTVISNVKITDDSIELATESKLNELFKAGDVVKLDTGNANYNVETIIVAVTGKKITFPGDTFTQLSVEGVKDKIISGRIVIERRCPDLDFVMESNNRLWGVSNKDNTIYGCKLGDPTNWFYYQATSMDSYAVEVGTDGEWTGCIPYSTHLLFFKEDCIHKLYGSTPATYQLSTSECYALEKGSSKSVAVLNERVLYKSRLGIMAYAGGTPELISSNFGNDRYLNAVGGTDGIKYYVSMENNGAYTLFVFDMERLLWHKEDNIKIEDFTFLNGKLLFIFNKLIIEINSDKPFEKKVDWMAELGPYNEYVEEKKIYSKIKLRLKLEKDSELEISMRIDNGDWEKLHRYYAENEMAVAVPIVPRRCFSFAIKLEGMGKCTIESCVREYREGAN